jgi:putative phosphonate metabolism protein
LKQPFDTAVVHSKWDIQMKQAVRYAIYFMPDPRSTLWEFGSRAVGYDAYLRRTCPFLDHPIYNHDKALDWTADPRRYGFHATLKAPFELREGASEADLVATAQAVASKTHAIQLDRLIVAEISAFVALVEAVPSQALAALAADCVRAFEPLRGPLSASDLARRLQTLMSERRRANLDRWGYHLVFEDFRFHMTLTGSLDADTQRKLKEVLEEVYANLDPRPVLIDAIAIYRQPSRDQQFGVLERFALAPAAA